MAKKDVEGVEEAPKSTGKKVLTINIVWEGKTLLAGAPVPAGLEEWLKLKKKDIAEYITEA